LPEDHLAWFVIEAVGRLDLTEFYAAYRAGGHGRAAYEPSMMVSLVLYAYSTDERSSRGIERRCRQDVAYRVITLTRYLITRRSPGSSAATNSRSTSCSAQC
jgi:transposase